MRDIDKAYLAGYLDADGCISVAFHDAGGRRLVVRARIAGRNKPLLEELEYIYGGGIFQKAGKRYAQWIWYVENRAAEEFLKDILPFLRLKKQQATLALEIIATLRRPGGRQASISIETGRYRWERGLKISTLNQLNLSNPNMDTKTMRRLRKLLEVT